MKHWFTFLLLLLIAVSCKKDSTLNPFDDCKSFDNKIDRDGCDFGVSFKTASPYHQKPCFNPNNADEFAYRKGNAIYKYTISSGTETLIKDDVRPLTQLDWGASGWITFTNNDWNVWILKDDGSELRQLTNNPRDWGPEFNSDGSQIAYGRRFEYSNYDLENSPNLRELYKIMIIGLDSLPIDSFCRRTGIESLCNPWDICSWSADDQKFAVPENGVRIYDAKGNPISERLSDHQVQVHYDLEWHPLLEKVFLTDEEGLKEIELSSGKFSTIKKSCDSLTYFDISISSDGNTILASRETATYDDCTITKTMELVLMDIDGGNERVIELTE